MSRLARPTGWEGDRICEDVLRLVRQIRAEAGPRTRPSEPPLLEPTGVFVPEDVRPYVMERA